MNRFHITIFMMLVATTQAVAQNDSMTFVGKSNIYATNGASKMGEATFESDTIIFAGSSFTLPSINYGDMTIPSFTITETNYSGGHDGVSWEDQTWTSTATDADGKEKTFTGHSLKGAFAHTDGIYKLVLSLTFSYGAMPMPITYNVEAYYVKPTTKSVSVIVGGSMGPYVNEAVTYDARIYEEEGAKKIDITMHEYKLMGTAFGDLTLGQYCVQGLTYDDAKGGYFRDYSTDENLTFHFESSNGVNDEYGFFNGGNLLVKMDGTNIDYAVNSFKPGSMPFPIVATFGTDSSVAIETIGTTTNSLPRKNKYLKDGRIYIEHNGKTYTTAGAYSY